MKPLYSISLVIAATLFAFGCDKDDNNVTPPDKDKDKITLPTKAYIGSEELDIEYNDAEVNGKLAAFYPDGMLPSRVPCIIFGSQIKLSEISEIFKDFRPISGPGVLPGSPHLGITPKFIPDGEGEYKFSGKDETEYVTFSYSGEISESKLDIDFEDVLLKNQVLAKTAWKPAPLEISGLDIKSSPLHIVWQSSLPEPMEGLDGTIQEALTLLSVLPIIPVYNNTAYMSVAQALASSLESVGFNPDGNAVVTYLQTVNGAAQFAQAPKCMIQYVPVSASLVKFYVNPTDLMGQILLNGSSHPDLPDNPFGKSTRAEIKTPTIESMKMIIEAFEPMISNGFPMRFVLGKDTLKIFFETEMLLPLVKDVIAPLLNDPLIKASIMEKLKANVELQQYLPKIEKLFEMLPQLLESTSRIELGLNFIKY